MSEIINNIVAPLDYQRYSLAEREATAPHIPTTEERFQRRKREAIAEIALIAYKKVDTIQQALSEAEGIYEVLNEYIKGE